ncbi:MAG TPA: sulfotransferase [Candidatus Polarisedimenticolia bacterium]|nr:sulfotransferase [Candidatus Polarisedimenticolia bacterium]
MSQQTLSPQQVAMLQLGMKAHRAGDTMSAERFYKKFSKTAPHNPQGLMLLGVLYAQGRRFSDAERFLARAVALSADPQTLNNYGAVLVELRRLPEAIGRLQQAVRLKPDYAEAQYNLGNALRQSGQTDQAIRAFREAVALKPDYAAALQNLSESFRDTGQYREAVGSLRQAIAVQPANAALHNNLGIALRETGQLDEARKAFDRAIALDTGLVHAYYHRVRAGTVAPGDAIITGMENLAAGGAKLDAGERATLGFALAKAYDDVGECDKAFSHLLEANCEARKIIEFDEPTELREFDRLQGKFNAPFISSRAGKEASSELPIFIVGFPRSGTTLTEQILASHPAVHGAGELALLPEIIYQGGDAALHNGTPEDDRINLQQLGELYVERLSRLAPAAQRITDKNPGNGPLIGFVHLMLPRARIIYVSRDPLDTCVSCFAQRFAPNNSPFAYDLGELGRRYRRYAGIMNHWLETLPPGSILPVRYESLVANLEQEVRRMLDYCGLAWDERCLDFHQADRSVRTASATQVRQPLYATSIGRWRRYEKHLAPLITALGDAAPQS